MKRSHYMVRECEICTLNSFGSEHDFRARIPGNKLDTSVKGKR